MVRQLLSRDGLFLPGQSHGWPPVKLGSNRQKDNTEASEVFIREAGMDRECIARLSS